MDFIDKEDIVAAEVGQDSREVAGTFDGGAGGRFNVNAYLGGDNVSKAGLTEAGRPVKQDMVDGLSPAFGGGNTDFEVIFYLLLPDKVGQGPRSETCIERCVFFNRFARYNARYFAPPWFKSLSYLPLRKGEDKFPSFVKRVHPEGSP